MPCIFCEEAGGHILWEDDFCRAVWAYEADYPALCRVIWDKHVREMTDLDEASRIHLMRVVFALEQALISVLQPVKVNLAGVFDLNGFNETLGPLTLVTSASSGAQVMTGTGILTLGSDPAVEVSGTGAAGAKAGVVATGTACTGAGAGAGAGAAAAGGAAATARSGRSASIRSAKLSMVE